MTYPILAEIRRRYKRLAAQGDSTAWLGAIVAVFLITQGWTVGTSHHTVVGPRRPPTVVNPLAAPGVRILYCTLTAYTADSDSTGKHPGDAGFGITATGQRVKQGVTVAVDPHVIPYGSRLYITGIGYRVAEDTGGAILGQHIDVYYRDDQTAIDFGVKRNVKVYVLPKETEPRRP